MKYREYHFCGIWQFTKSKNLQINSLTSTSKFYQNHKYHFHGINNMFKSGFQVVFN